MVSGEPLTPYPGEGWWDFRARALAGGHSQDAAAQLWNEEPGTVPVYPVFLEIGGEPYYYRENWSDLSDAQLYGAEGN